MSQKTLQDAVAAHEPPRVEYIKDKPILAWSLTSDRIEDLPETIRDALGSVDETNYTSDYLAENIGSVIALQMTSDGPTSSSSESRRSRRDYSVVPIEDLLEKNAEAVERLDMAPEVKALFEARDPSITAVLKSEPVEMIRMSEIGFPEDSAATIAAPWGEQTKPAGQEGFLVFDSEQKQYYLVNQDEDGNPLSYVPAD